MAQIVSWLPKLAYAIRLGTHNQSMFAFGLMLDWARAAGNRQMAELVTERSLRVSPRGPELPPVLRTLGRGFSVTLPDGSGPDATHPAAG